MVLGAAVTKWLIPEARQADGLARPLEELQYLAKIRRPAKKKAAAPEPVNGQGASVPEIGPNGVLTGEGNANMNA